MTVLYGMQHFCFDGWWKELLFSSTWHSRGWWWWLVHVGTPSHACCLSQGVLGHGEGVCELPSPQKAENSEKRKWVFWDSERLQKAYWRPERLWVVPPSPRRPSEGCRPSPLKKKQRSRRDGLWSDMIMGECNRGLEGVTLLPLPPGTQGHFSSFHPPPSTPLSSTTLVHMIPQIKNKRVQRKIKGLTQQIGMGDQWTSIPLDTLGGGIIYT